MKKTIWLLVMAFIVCLAIPQALLAGKGYMGGKGDVVVEEEPPPDTGGEGEMPSDIEGPLNDKMADAGKLYGDLYVILRQTGVAGDKKLVPQVDEETGAAVMTTTDDDYFAYGDYPGTYQALVSVTQNSTLDDVVGGEPVLTVIDPGNANAFADYGWYAVEVGLNPDETPIYGVGKSPFPAQCVQPVANYDKWGDINSTGKTGLTKNRIPMVATYDATWNRSECAVGKVVGEVTADPVTGELTIPIDPYFIQPGESWLSPVSYDADGNVVRENVTYPDGVLWTDLIGEVHFGRLNLGRAPEAVLQAAFDEAINNLNSDDTEAIEIDPAGRLLLTKNVYDPLLVDPLTGLPLWIDEVKKAIDSPLENMALYLKLMQDGHLVTPGDERAPIDRSKHGGIPIWKMLELEDGPADAALRPTIDIAKLEAWGLGSLVDVAYTDYYTYYQCVDAIGGVVQCLCWDPDPMQPELDGKWVACADVVDRELFVVDSCPDGIDCEGPFTGIKTDGTYAPDGADLDFTAAFLAAAADKTGEITWDMVVYLNSIMGINKVVGYSEYDADGNPTADAIDYEKNPVYFNFRGAYAYGETGRASVFGYRGQGVEYNAEPLPAGTYNGNVRVLQGASPTWSETVVPILGAQMDGASIFDNIGRGADSFPDESVAAENILGFTQQSDDDLSVIKFIHTYQIPGLR